jgi:hypothetical protein
LLSRFARDIRACPSVYIGAIPPRQDEDRGHLAAESGANKAAAARRAA